MAEILLHDAIQDMRADLGAGRLSSALERGRHILQFYPKHIETYLVLAQVCLKSGDLANAQDLLRRVLSSDPENVIALAGMALISEAQEKSDEALWYIERAYEIAPSNDELRGELLRLREQFYGTAPARIELTSGALARVYARQGQYAQAINEFRRLLRNDSKRYDARVALAEALYRAGRNDEAAQIAQAVMADAPYALKPNLILGALWTENQVPEGQQFLQRAHQLDPEHRTARALLGERFDGAQAPRLPEFGERTIASAPTQLTESLAETETPRAAALLIEIERAQEPIFDEPLFADQETIERVEREGTRELTESPAVSPLETVVAAAVVTQAVESVATPETFSGQSSDATLNEIAVAEQAATPPPAAPAAAPSTERASKTGLDTDAIAAAAAALATSIALDKTKQPSPALRAHPSLPKVRPVIASAQGKLPAWLYISAPPANAPASFDAPAAEERPDWLVQAEEANLSSQVVTPDDAALPEWLKPAAVAATTAAVVSETQKSPQAELPEWLRDEPAAVVPTVETAQAADTTFAASPTESVAAAQAPTISELPPERAPVVETATLAAESTQRAFDEPVAPTTIAPEQTPSAKETVLEITPSEAVPAVESVAATAAPVETVPPVETPAPERAPTQAMPDSATMLQMARDKRASGDLKGALDLYERVLHRRPNYLEQLTGDLEEIVKAGGPTQANRLLGEAYVMAGRYKESLEQTRIAMGKTQK